MGQTSLIHVSACANPKLERDDAFYDQLAGYIRWHYGESRPISIRGVSWPVDPTVNLPYLRQYGVSYIAYEE